MKEAKSHMKIIWMVFSNEILAQLSHFGFENELFPGLWIRFKDIFWNYPKSNKKYINQIRGTLMVCQKKWFRAIRQFWVQKWRTIISLDHIEQFFKIAQWKGQRDSIKTILMVFLKKLFVKQAHHIGPKNDASSELLIRCKDFLKFCTMKGAKRYMKMILLNFPKKYSLGQLSHFGPKDCTCLELWFCWKDLAQSKMTKGTSKSYQWFFGKKSHSGQSGHFGPKMMCRHNFASALAIVVNFVQCKEQRGTSKLCQWFFRKYSSLGQMLY